MFNLIRTSFVKFSIRTRTITSFSKGQKIRILGCLKYKLSPIINDVPESCFFVFRFIQSLLENENSFLTPFINLDVYLIFTTFGSN